ncbi:MAG: cupin domain-containing protein [Steroidobacteraceae bacterium]
MLLNEDLSRRAVVHAAEVPWVPSPTAGVERRMLFRIGTEQARATSIVRYAPGSDFPRHVHPGGEEFLVLDGVFQDERGDYPAGSYVRNPPASAHAPASAVGCIIFVKLWQFRRDDAAFVTLRPGEGRARSPGENQQTSRVLFDDTYEQVRLDTWAAHAPLHLPNPLGLEVLVVGGRFTQDGEPFARESWLRLPAGEELRAFCGPEGATLWVKSAPLMHAAVCAF